MSSEPYFPGLEGVIAGETAISTITGGLEYRGYGITDLAEQSIQILSEVFVKGFHDRPLMLARRVFFKRARSRNSFSAIAPRETPSIRAISASLWLWT